MQRFALSKRNLLAISLLIALTPVQLLQWKLDVDKIEHSPALVQREHIERRQPAILDFKFGPHARNMIQFKYKEDMKVFDYFRGRLPDEQRITFLPSNRELFSRAMLPDDNLPPVRLDSEYIDGKINGNQQNMEVSIKMTLSLIDMPEIIKKNPEYQYSRLIILISSRSSLESPVTSKDPAHLLILPFMYRLRKLVKEKRTEELIFQKRLINCTIRWKKKNGMKDMPCGRHLIPHLTKNTT